MTRCADSAGAPVSPSGLEIAFAVGEYGRKFFVSGMFRLSAAYMLPIRISSSRQSRVAPQSAAISFVV